MMKYFFFILLFTAYSFSAWWGNLPSPDDLHMKSKDAAFFYSFLGLLSGWAFIHHFRSF